MSGRRRGGLTPKPAQGCPENDPRWRENPSHPRPHRAAPAAPISPKTCVFGCTTGKWSAHSQSGARNPRGNEATSNRHSSQPTGLIPAQVLLRPVSERRRGGLTPKPAQGCPENDPRWRENPLPPKTAQGCIRRVSHADQTKNFDLPTGTKFPRCLSWSNTSPIDLRTCAPPLPEWDENQEIVQSARLVPTDPASPRTA